MLILSTLLRLNKRYIPLIFSSLLLMVCIPSTIQASTAGGTINWDVVSIKDTNLPNLHATLYKPSNIVSSIPGIVCFHGLGMNNQIFRS